MVISNQSTVKSVNSQHSISLHRSHKTFQIHFQIQQQSVIQFRSNFHQPK